MVDASQGHARVELLGYTCLDLLFYNYHFFLSL